MVKEKARLDRVIIPKCPQNITAFICSFAGYNRIQINKYKAEQTLTKLVKVIFIKIRC